MGNNIIKFPKQEDLTIEFERTEDYYKAADELSEYIADLSLNNDDSDKLIVLIMEQAKQAAQGALIQGFELGIDFCKHNKNIK